MHLLRYTVLYWCSVVVGETGMEADAGISDGSGAGEAVVNGKRKR